MTLVEMKRTNALKFSSTVPGAWGQSMSDVKTAKSFLVSNPHHDSKQIKVPARLVDSGLKANNYPNANRDAYMSSGAKKTEDFSHMTDNSHLVMNEEQWAEFSAALEAPPKELTNLRKLFSKPTVFD